MTTIRIASRASQLALSQSEEIRSRLLELDPGLDISIVKITTQGDVDKSDYLHQARSIGMFTSEVQNALLDKRADLAVHSFKDLPTTGPAELTTAAIPLRESAADVLISCHPVPGGLADLPSGSTMGTSSLRRIAQVRQLRPDLQCQPLRGNIETRLHKVTSGQVESIIIAHAGLNRLGLADHISAILDTEQFIPAPAQGALAIQTRSDDAPLRALVEQLDHPPTRIAVTTERQVLSQLHGGCSIPLGVHATLDDSQRLTLRAVLSSVDGQQQIRHTLHGPANQAPELARDMARYLLDHGAQELLSQIRLEQ